jgi:hypothetical protein
LLVADGGVTRQPDFAPLVTEQFSVTTSRPEMTRAAENLACLTKSERAAPFAY